MSENCSSSVYGHTVAEDDAACIARQQKIIEELQDRVKRLKEIAEDAVAKNSSLLVTDANSAQVIRELGQELLDRNIAFSNLRTVYVRLLRKMHQCPVCKPGPPAV